MDYSVTHVEDRDVAILRVQGDLDFDERARFQQAMDELFAAESRRLVVDLSKITRMSSVYIGTLVTQGNVAKSQGKTLSVSVPQQIAKICQQSGLDKVTRVIISEGQ